jgi:hypothetical protein
MAQRIGVTSFIARDAVGRPGHVADPSPSDAARPIAPGPVSAKGAARVQDISGPTTATARLLHEMAARAAGSAG